MKTTPLAIVTSAVLLAAAGGCQPCTCPAAAPAPAVLPPPPPAQAAPAQPAPATPATPPAPTAPAPAEPLRITNESSATRLMAGAVPRQIYDAGITGDVLVDLTLNADGTVESAVDVEATNDTFRAPALRVARALRFTPTAPGTQVRVRMHFSRRTEIELVQP